MTFTIDELPIPASIDAPGGADFVRSIEVGNAVYIEAYGTDELNYEPAEELPHYRDAFQPHRLLLARVDGQIVGRGLCETEAGDEVDTAWLNVDVLPEFRGRGIGTALADAIESIARGLGAEKAITYIGIPEADGERLPSPTGFGSVPAADASVRFLSARGYRLEQIERASRMPLPVANLDERLADARAQTGDAYRLHHWFGGTPEHWREDIAVLGNRMSTDAPSAGLDEPEEEWTVERVIAADERDLASPRTRTVTVAEHVASGNLVGFTVLSVPAQKHRSVAQYATLVMREHRGHRLGMLLKLANLAYLESVAPGHPSVTTFNAEENRYMLDVNEAMGFVPISCEGAFRKDLE
jgi:GNAT superfamily N-acetyltransferase